MIWYSLTLGFALVVTTGLLRWGKFMANHGFVRSMTGSAGVRNKILLALPPAVLADILAHMEHVELERDQRLYQPDGRVRRVHFIQSGMAIFTKMMRDGRSTMIGSVGCEGMTAPHGFGDTVRTDIECTIHIPGTSLAIHSDMLQGLSARHLVLQDLLERCGRQMDEHLAQHSGCNRLHALEQRCARLLLTIHDNAGAAEFSLTQETLSVMLGAQRPHISSVAANFRANNLIQYKHGQMKVLNPGKLRKMSCECYDALKEQAGN